MSVFLSNIGQEFFKISLVLVWCWSRKMTKEVFPPFYILGVCNAVISATRCLVELISGVIWSCSLGFSLHIHCVFSKHTAGPWTAGFHDAGPLTCVLSHSVVSDSVGPRGLWPPRLLCPWDSPGQNTGVGSPALLQGIFPTQGLNPGLPHCRRILCHLSQQGSPGPFWWVFH